MDADGYKVSERRLVLLACCLSGFITPLLSTMMNLSLVSIGEEFGVGSHNLAYVNTAFLLSSVVFMVPLAKCADLYGKKRMYITGLAVITVASIMAMVSPSFWWLIACRVMMGFGSAAMVTTSISMITDVFPGNMRGGAIGMQTMCVYIGLAAGPPLGGIFNEMLGWHSLFLIILPLAVGSLVCITLFRHEITPDAGGAFDGKGSILYAVGIVLTMGGVINLPQTWAFAMLPVGLIIIALFVWRQLRVKDYLLNVRLFKKRVFAGSCTAAFLNYAASYSISYFMALYLQSIGSMTSSEAGMLMLIQAAIQAVLTPYFGRLSDHVADKRVLPTVGMALTGVGVSMFLFYGTELDLAMVLATMLFVGVGTGIFSAPNTSVIMGSVPRNETSEASGVVAVMRQTGMMLSMGIAMLFISVIMGGSDNLTPENYGLFTDVLHCSFAVCLAMCAVGVVASLMRGNQES